jgi:hypothetical protein
MQGIRSISGQLSIRNIQWVKEDLIDQLGPSLTLAECIQDALDSNMDTNTIEDISSLPETAPTLGASPPLEGMPPPSSPALSTASWLNMTASE